MSKPLLKPLSKYLLKLQCTVTLVLVFTAGTPSALAANSHSVDFSGTWELDYQRSDQVVEKMRLLYQAARTEAERQASRMTRDPRRPIVISKNANRIGDYEAVMGLGQLAEMISSAGLLTIAQQQNQIIIERNDDFSLVCHFDKAQHLESRLGQERCGWLQDRLRFDINLPEGLSVSHLLTMAPGGHLLNLATTVKSTRTSQPFTLNRVYLPVEPLQDLYNCQFSLENKTSCTLGGSAK